MHLMTNIEIAHFNIYDPRNLENLDNLSRDILVKNGHIIKMNLNFSSDKYFRHFSCELFKKINNNEISDRKWIIYCRPS